MAPPYDVISPSQQGAFYAKHPKNVIRLILGKEEAGDSARENKYTRAGNYLNGWINEGVLAEEDFVPRKDILLDVGLTGVLVLVAG